MGCLYVTPGTVRAGVLVYCLPGSHSGKQLAVEGIDSLVLTTGTQSFSGNRTKVLGSECPVLEKVGGRDILHDKSAGCSG